MGCPVGSAAAEASAGWGVLGCSAQRSPGLVARTDAGHVLWVSG